MGIEVGIALLIAGLILATGAVDVPDRVNNVIATDTVGWICLVVGALHLALAVVLIQQRSRAAQVVVEAAVRRLTLAGHPWRPSGGERRGPTPLPGVPDILMVQRPRSGNGRGSPRLHVVPTSDDRNRSKTMTDNMQPLSDAELAAEAGTALPTRRSSRSSTSTPTSTWTSASTRRSTWRSPPTPTWRRRSMPPSAATSCRAGPRRVPSPTRA